MVKYKLIKYIMITIILGLLIGYIFLRYPTSFCKNYTGLKYRLGVENTDKVEEIRVTFDGKITKDFWLNKKFVGKIDIDDIEDLLHNKEYIQELHNVEVELAFDSDMSAPLAYHFVKDGKPEIEWIGIIYFDNLLKAFTIQVYEPTDSDSRNWNARDGLMITAPITSRVDAIELSNELMENRLYCNGESFILK